jgi:MFS transporter, DHA1 family, tetracycline resistance protein
MFIGGSAESLATASDSAATAPPVVKWHHAGLPWLGLAGHDDGTVNENTVRFPMSPAANRASLAFVMVTVTLDILAIGLIVPVLPKLVEQFLGGDTSRAAAMFGYMSVTWALMQFVFSPILGALSDRFGRRPILLLSNLGLGLDYILMALAPTLAWLFVGRILSGIAAATFSTANAYISDVTPAEKRAGAFGMIGAAFGIGFVFGPAIGGILGASDPRLPFWVAAGLSLANAVYGYFVLPESLKPELRAPFKFRNANPLAAFKLLFGRPDLRGLSSVLFFYHLSHAVLPAVSVLFMGYRFGFGPQGIGLTLAIVGVCSAIVQAGLVKPAVARFGARTTMLIGLVCGTLGFVIQGITTSPVLYLVGIPFFTLWGLITPAAQQIMTGRVGPDAYGQLSGANASLMSVANMIGPLVFSQIFAWAIAGGPGAPWAGAPFLLAATLLGGATLLALRDPQR